jgi:hypothetical protein
MRWLALPLWRDFLAAMHLKKLLNAGLLTDEAQRYGRGIYVFAVVRDCFYNLTWAWLYFKDRPRELLVTQRLERYKFGRAYRIVLLRGDGGWRIWKFRLAIEEVKVSPEDGWRLDETRWLEVNMLDAPDPTLHHLRPPDGAQVNQ